MLVAVLLLLCEGCECGACSGYQGATHAVTLHTKGEIGTKVAGLHRKHHSEARVAYRVQELPHDNYREYSVEHKGTRRRQCSFHKKVQGFSRRVMSASTNDARRGKKKDRDGTLFSKSIQR